MCQLGAKKSSVLSILETIHGMHHHMHTVHGDSTRFASRQTWDQPVAGIGQGNGAGPAIWAAVSSPLFTIMQEDRFLATVICAMIALCNLPQVTGLHCGLTRIDLTSEQSFLLAHGRNIEFYLHQHKNNGKIPFACSFSSKCQYYSSFQFKHSFCEVLIFLNHHLIHCKCNGINHF